MDTTNPRSNTARKKEFDHAGHALVRSHQRARAAPESTRRQQAFAKAAARVLAAARDLPDKGQTQRDNQGDPALSARVFGAAYAHQRNPTDRRVQGELLALVAVYYRERQEEKKEREEAEAKASKRDDGGRTTQQEQRSGGQRPMPQQVARPRTTGGVKTRMSRKVDLSRNHRR